MEPDSIEKDANIDKLLYQSIECRKDNRNKALSSQRAEDATAEKLYSVRGSRKLTVLVPLVYAPGTRFNYFGSQ